VTLSRVVVTGCALWLSAQFVSGIRLSPELAPLATVGTVLVVAILLCLVETLTQGVRRTIAAIAEPLPLAVLALMGLNTVLFWLTGRLAAAAGLGYTVDGLLPALFGAVVLLLVGWVSRLVRP
jgi:putative membrane protein